MMFWRALRTLPNLEIIEGDFRTRKIMAAVVSPPPNFMEVFKTEEKGSDVNLAAHLLLDGFRNRYKCAIVISGDSDLVITLQPNRNRSRLLLGQTQEWLSQRTWKDQSASFSDECQIPSG